MTASLAAGSERVGPARRFGRALGRSMAARGISERRLAEVTGISRSGVRQYRCGYNLPSLANGQALAAALDDDGLATLIRRCRTERCAICSSEFVNEGTPQRYCSDVCRGVAAKKRFGVETRVRADVAERGAAAAESTLAQFREAVAAMCLACEPEGACRTADCSLRPVSPLPMSRAKTVVVASPAPGPYGTEENRQKTLAAIRAGLARRWTPEARAEQSRRAKDFHAGLTDEQRAAHASSIATGRARRAS